MADASGVETRVIWLHTRPKLGKVSLKSFLFCHNTSAAKPQDGILAHPARSAMLSIGEK